MCSNDASGDGATPNSTMPLQRSNPTVMLIRAPLLGLLSVDAGPGILLQPFKSPLQGHSPGTSAESQRKTLGCRLKGYNRGFGLAFKLAKSGVEEVATDPKLPPDNPLTLYKDENVEIKVDSILSRFLRDHQRQGVQFIFDCLMGFKEFKGRGCILADDMGLGKTLQSITVMWTLLCQGLEGRPTARKCAVVCPASLVNNWESEIQKWLHGKCECTAVADSHRDKVIAKFQGFRYNHRSKVIIASYETFRMHVDRLEGVPIDLVICDEAHRLKNDKTLTSVSIAKLPAQMRLMLSGTPIQNDLNEFYALVSLCNPDVLGDAATFRRQYANPILLGREPDATDAEQKIASERLAELSHITNQFVLRRTNALLSKVLPPKLVLNIFCRLAPCQLRIYKAFTKSKSWSRLVNDPQGVSSRTLAAIQSLMKLCNHPCLVRKGGVLSNQEVDEELIKLEQATSAMALKNAGNLAVRQHTTRSANGIKLSNSPGHGIVYEHSGKVLLLYRLLYHIRTKTNDRVVIISNYTSTLDVFERLCRQCNFPRVRLDGALSIKKRHQLVTTFNDPMSNSFVFLLSSKAGGCGINLIGANRLVLFDPDWNPANDKQALARVWRDGQKKQCFIYRFFSTGTIEEKIYQRQICKDGLSSMIVTDGINELKDALSDEFLRNLFEYKSNTLSDTHDSLECEKCDEEADGTMVPHEQDANLVEDDLNTWAHYKDASLVPDEMLRLAATKNEPQCDLEDPNFEPVSFVMGCRVQYIEPGSAEAVAKAEADKKALEAAKANKNKVEKKQKTSASASQSDEEVKVETKRGKGKKSSASQSDEDKVEKTASASASASPSPQPLGRRGRPKKDETKVAVKESPPARRTKAAKEKVREPSPLSSPDSSSPTPASRAKARHRSSQSSQASQTSPSQSQSQSRSQSRSQMSSQSSTASKRTSPRLEKASRKKDMEVAVEAPETRKLVATETSSTSATDVYIDDSQDDNDSFINDDEESGNLHSSDLSAGSDDEEDDDEEDLEEALDTDQSEDE